MTTLQSYFAARAALAFIIGQAERDGTPVPAGVLRRYRITERKLRAAQRTAGDPPPLVPLTPEWCTLCGSATQPKTAGHLLCLACEAAHLPRRK